MGAKLPKLQESADDGARENLRSIFILNKDSLVGSFLPQLLWQQDMTLQFLCHTAATVVAGMTAMMRMPSFHACTAATHSLQLSAVANRGRFKLALSVAEDVEKIGNIRTVRLALGF